MKEGIGFLCFLVAEEDELRLEVTGYMTGEACVMLDLEVFSCLIGALCGGLGLEVAG